MHNTFSHESFNVQPASVPGAACAMSNKSCVAIAACTLYMLVKHDGLALRVHTNIAKLVRRLAVQSAELQAAILNIHMPVCIVGRSSNA